MYSRILGVVFLFLVAQKAFCANDSLLVLGLQAYDKGDYSASVIFLERSLEMAQKENNAEFVLRSVAYLARSLRKDKAEEKAHLLYSDSTFYELYSSNSSVSDLSKAEFLTMRGLLSYSKNELKSAESDLLLALSLMKFLDKASSQKVYASNILGNVYEELGAYNNALTFYDAAIQENLGQFEPNERDLSISYSNAGIIYRRMGNFDRAMDYMLKDLEIWQRLFPDDEYGIAVSLFNIGSVYLDNGDYRRAIDYNFKALPAFISVFGEDHINTSYVYNNLSIGFLNVSEMDLAIKYDQLSFSIKVKEYGENHNYVALAYINSAGLFRNVGDYQKAYDYSKRSHDIRKRLFGDDNSEILNNYVMLAGHAGYLGKNKEALRWAEDGLDVHQKKHPYHYRYRADLLQARASANVNLKRFDKAISDFEAAFSIYVEHGGEDNFARQMLTIRKNYIETLREMSAVNSDIAFLERAAEFANSSMNLVTAIQQGVSYETSLYGSSQLIHEFLFLATKVNIELYEKSKDARWLEMAFHATERAKTGVLRRQMLDLKARNFAGIPEDLIIEERSLNRQIADLETQILTQNPDEVNSELSDSLFTMRQKRITFVKKLETDYPKYYELKYQDKVSSLEKVQRNLAPYHTVIEFLTFENEIILFAIRPDSVYVSQISLDASFQDLMRSHKRSINFADTDVAKRLGAEIFETLFSESLRKTLTQSDMITFIPEDFLTQIPFEALWDAQSGKYIIEHADVDYALSASFEPQQNRLNLNKYAGFAPVNFSEAQIDDAPVWRGSLVPLPNSQREITRFASILENAPSDWWSFWNPKQVNLFLQSNATEKAIRALDLDGGILHLATHTQVETNNPNLSKIYLNQQNSAPEDGIWHQNEIFSHSTNAGLVIMSSCASGTGQYVKGEGVLGLTHAFFYTGVSKVIVTQWSVLDLSSAELIIRFGEELAGGKSVVQALSQAKRRMLQTKHFSSPVHWAPFVVFQ